jgi:hypothetical protein
MNEKRTQKVIRFRNTMDVVFKREQTKMNTALSRTTKAIVQLLDPNHRQSNAWALKALLLQVLVVRTPKPHAGFSAHCTAAQQWALMCILQ